MSDKKKCYRCGFVVYESIRKILAEGYWLMLQHIKETGIGKICELSRSRDPILLCPHCFQLLETWLRRDNWKDVLEESFSYTDNNEEKKGE